MAEEKTLSISESKLKGVSISKYYPTTTEDEWVKESKIYWKDYYNSNAIVSASDKRNLKTAVKMIIAWKKASAISKLRPTEEYPLLKLSRNRYVHDLLTKTIESKFAELKLYAIFEEIDQSKYILELKKGWDQEDANPIENSLYEKSISFLLNYVAHLIRVHRIIIESPEINPVRDGSIDLSWRVGDYRLLINIKKKDGECLAYYYADQINNKKFIKGVVTVIDVDESLAAWMKNLKA